VAADVKRGHVALPSQSWLLALTLQGLVPLAQEGHFIALPPMTEASRHGSDSPCPDDVVPRSNKELDGATRQEVASAGTRANEQFTPEL